MTMKFRLIDTGSSHSFPDLNLLAGSNDGGAGAVLIVGRDAQAGLASLAETARREAIVILVELGAECLGVHADEAMGCEGGNLVGFSRFRLGRGGPSPLVEVVRQPRTRADSLEAGRALFESLGLSVAICRDSPGRILDRLLRPYFNAALTRLDDGLADAQGLDRALRLGLGYPQGPIELLDATGLAEHHDVSMALHHALEAPGFLPARRAQVAAARRRAAQGGGQ